MSKEPVKCDLLILGAVAVGISAGIAYLEDFPGSTVVIADKEDQISQHASRRNSGILRAGFYYLPESLKEKFCREGNIALSALVKKRSLSGGEINFVNHT